MTMTNNEIEQTSMEILNKYNKRGGSHEQLFNIIQEEGIKFKEIASSNAKFIGALTFGNNKQTYIMINKGIENIGRRNFTIAHELGHYFLNHKLHTSSFLCQEDHIVEGSDVSNRIEQEANYFASCFLMPKQIIKGAFLAMIRHSKKINIKNFLIVNKANFGVWCGIRDCFMKRYGVSEAALRYRLIGLQLARFDF